MGSSDQHFLQTPRAAGRAWSGSVWPASVGTATQGPPHARSTAIFSRARSPPYCLPSLRLLLWISCLSHISCLPQTLPDPQRGAKCPGRPLLPAQLASLPLPASHAPTAERVGEPWEEGTPELPGPRGRPQPQGAASRRWAGQRVSWEGEPRSRNLSHLHLVIGLFLGPQPPTFLWASIQSARPGMRRQGGPHHHSVRRAATRIPHCCDVQTPGRAVVSRSSPRAQLLRFRPGSSGTDGAAACLPRPDMALPGSKGKTSPGPRQALPAPGYISSSSRSSRDPLLPWTPNHLHGHPSWTSLGASQQHPQATISMAQSPSESGLTG